MLRGGRYLLSRNYVRRTKKIKFRPLHSHKWCFCANDGQLAGGFCYPGIELELELIQTQMTQKPMLRAEVYARALRASQNRKEDSL